MSKKHEKKYTSNLLVGLILTTAGIAIIIYVALADKLEFDWIVWAIIAAVVINGGLLFLGSALVHKVKADLTRRQKHKTKADTAMAPLE